MKDGNNTILLKLIVISSLIVCIIGLHWNNVYRISDNPISGAMIGLHDKVYYGEFEGVNAKLAANNLSDLPNEPIIVKDALGANDSESETVVSDEDTEPAIMYDFTTVDDSYFDDACFIGDSRTVGLSKYAGIENATFLCATSLTIFDYEKPKITYEGEKTSIRDVLSENRFGKIYIMFGINECGSSSAERFFETYANAVNDIRLLQPGTIVFVEGNLLVTSQSSMESEDITNDNISLRNYYLSLLENKQDIFYIDINTTELCEDGALVPDYTWDQVHIKAQYYPIWKDFLLSHGIQKDA
jgi:hypothetical protein